MGFVFLIFYVLGSNIRNTLGRVETHYRHVSGHNNLGGPQRYNVIKGHVLQTHRVLSLYPKFSKSQSNRVRFKETNFVPENPKPDLSLEIKKSRVKWNPFI